MQNCQGVQGCDEFLQGMIERVCSGRIQACTSLPHTLIAKTVPPPIETSQLYKIKNPTITLRNKFRIHGY